MAAWGSKQQQLNRKKSSHKEMKRLEDSRLIAPAWLPLGGEVAALPGFGKRLDQAAPSPGSGGGRGALAGAWTGSRSSSLKN